MATRILSDYLPASLAGITDDQGNSIVSPDTSGETAQLFGDTATRTINTMVTNGLFSLPPADGTAVITTDNPLPYFTYAATGTGITARIVADSDQSTGNVLRFTIAANTTGTATISTFIPLDGTRGLNQTSMAQMAWGSATQSATAYVTSRLVAYKQDQTTAITNGTTAGGTIAWNQYGAIDWFESVGGYNPYPETAAFMKIEATVYTATSAGTARSIDLRSIINNTAHAQVWALPDLDSTYATPMTIQKLSDLTTIDAVGSLEINAPDGFTVAGDITGNGVTKNLKHGITLQRTTNLTVNTSIDGSATAITWSSAVKNTALYAYWSSGSTITIPLAGWYSITCHLISGTGLGTGFAFRLYALVNGTVIAETETQAGANTTTDTFSISTIAYMNAADSLVFRASASAASKTIGGSRRSACSVVYLGDTTS
jgi:hypothetical protein